MTSLNAIAPEDIEAIDVLKDGSAAAIYGTRGNNGVIIVSTRRPQAGTTQVDYSGYIMHEAVYKRPEIYFYAILLCNVEIRGLLGCRLRL